MKILYEHSQKREENRMIFEAKLHGAKFKDEEISTFVDSDVKEEKVEFEGPLFKDPEVYAKMTEEERQKETDRLMAFTKRWAGTKPLGGKEPRIIG